ncbi:Magnesium transporter MRS2-1 [Rhynchospora pubera]|uniref:Magnesium transporter n=1 Tax=Rhynchospora pubera TaxID=906938 RepID=A0AAV8CBS6_9POAL|nr:Magnesium transporter MRS2-1 [Rhynchospora pubera]
MHIANLEKKTPLHSWIRIEASTGASSCVSLDKVTIMRQYNLPSRDLHLLDPLLAYPSTIVSREKAIVLNLENIRCIITADELLVSVEGLSCNAPGLEWQYVELVKRRLASRSDKLPFEFVALDVALEETCDYLNALVRDEIENLVDDDDDMAELYLTRKKHSIESSHSEHGNPGGPGLSVSAPTSPVGSPIRTSAGQKKLERNFSFARSSRHEISRIVETGKLNIEEVGLLLEAHFVVVDITLNKLISLKGYIDDAEDFINIQLDNVRNQLIQVDLLLSTASFIVAILGVVVGIFGMNFPYLFLTN